MWQRCSGVSSNRDQFSGDGDSDFFRSNRTNIEPNRGVNTIKKMRGQPLFLKRLEYLNYLALGPDHPDIPRPCLHRPAQQSHVVVMTARDDDDVGRFGRIKLPGGFIEIESVHFARAGEALLGG